MSVEVYKKRVNNYVGKTLELHLRLIQQMIITFQRIPGGLSQTNTRRTRYAFQILDTELPEGCKVADTEVGRGVKSEIEKEMDRATETPSPPGTKSSFRMTIGENNLEVCMWWMHFGKISSKARL
jgi:hypothetical protein